jgi:4-hydroxy-tetrahydrodipicolinate synthase
MFTGLSAFPLTPLLNGFLDEKAFIKLVVRLTQAKVDSIGALGSTGNYAYLSRSERSQIAKLAVEHSENIPVMVSIGALRISDILLLAEDAQVAGVGAVLLAPVSYQKLTQDEVYGLYAEVCRNLSVPLCIYDNPGTTHFEFSDELYVRISELPHVKSIKIPGLPTDTHQAKSRIEKLRSILPSKVTIGISGDWHAMNGIKAGCDIWYSVIAGLYPRLAREIMLVATSDDLQLYESLTQQLEPLWALFKQFGSLRVIAAAAELEGIVTEACLPAPLMSLNLEARKTLTEVINQMKAIVLISE